LTVNKDEFIQSQKSIVSRETRRAWMYLGIGLGIVALIAAVAKSVIHSVEVEDFFISLVTVKRHLLLAGLGLLLMMLMAAVAAISRDSGGLKCPNCGKSIRGFGARITLITSNCGFCGERILS